MEKLTIEEAASFCKQKGYVYPSSEIYGGISGFWDFGPNGIELFNNLKSSWWKFFVNDRDDIAGLDASIISHPMIWKASGHLESFGDALLVCSKCKAKFRADHFLEEKLNRNVEGMKNSELNKMIIENNLKCPNCNSDFSELKDFNLLFKTHAGAEEGKKDDVYLRGETAQGMFIDFKMIFDTTRQKIPFGIAQIGKCFRNEISPRDFLFRSREFSIAEFEYFIHPDDKKCPMLDEEHKKLKLNLLDRQTQVEGKKTLNKTSIGKMVADGRLGEWHAYFLAEQILWLSSLGLNMEKIKIREHTKTELSHYSSATFDLDYKYPFGSKEVGGNANRGQYDLKQHIKSSKANLAVFDEESKSKIIPRVIEPTFGMDRVFLAVIIDAYEFDEKRGNIVLKLKPELAPIKVAVFPLVNKLHERARKIYEDLRKEFTCFFDKSGSIGRRYARQDELGTPFCVTVDFESEDEVTIRDRDSTKQARVKISALKETLEGIIKGTIDFKSLILK